MTEKETIKKLIAYCKCRMDETPEIKQGYYHKKKSLLERMIKPKNFIWKKMK